MPSTRSDAALVVAGTVLAALLGAFVATAGTAGLALPIFALAAYVAWQLAARVIVRPSLAIVGVAALAPTLASTGTVIQNGAGQLLPVAVFAACLIFMPRNSAIDGRTLVAATVYAGLVVAALLRGAMNGSIADKTSAISSALVLGLIVAFGIRLFTSGSAEDRRLRMAAVVLAPAVYIVANIALLLVGDRLPLITITDASEGLAAGEPATMLQAIGFSGATRIAYPMASGVNSFGIIAATGFMMAALATWQYRRAGWERLLFGIAAAICLGAVFTTDSRTALIVAVLLLAVAALRLRSQSARRLAALLPLAPVALVALLSYLSSSWISELLSRDGGDFATGTGRTKIWEGIIDGTLSQPAAIHIVGYGGNGQLTSGAYQDYAYVFRGQEQSLFTAHDIYLQTVLDIGYIGLAALIWVVYVAINRLLTSRDPLGPVVGWAIGVMMLCGVTEAIPSYQFMDAMALFALLITCQAVARPPAAVQDETGVAVGHTATPQQLRV